MEKPMEKLKRELNSHNLLHYIIVFCLVVFLVTMILSVYLYSFFFRTVYDDFLTGNEQRLTAAVERHENDMRIVKDVVTQVGMSDDMTKFYLERQPDKSIKLKKQLNRYTMVSQFFDVVFYHYHKDDYMYSYSGSVNINKLPDYGFVPANLSYTDFEMLLKEEEPKLRILPEQGVDGEWIEYYLANEDSVMFFQTIPPDYSDTLLFMVPGSYYDKLLGSTPEEQRLAFIFYDGKLVTSRGSLAVSEESLCSMLADKTKFQDEVKLDGESYLLSVEMGESGIVYGSLQSMEIFYDKIMTDQWGILIFIMMCIIPFTFIIVIVSDKLMKKVKNLNLLLNEEANYNLSSIENGIQSLVMNKKETESEHLTLKKTRFIRDFIRGGISTHAEILAEADKAKLKIDYSHYIVVLIRSREMDGENKVYTTMLEIIEKYESVGGYGVHLINNDQNLFVLFSNEKQILEKCLSMMIGIERNYCEEYIMAVSNYHTDFSEGGKAYLEANTAFDNHLLMDNNQIIRFSEVVQREYVNFIPDIYLQKLRYAIRTGDMQAVEAVAKDICSKMNSENASLYAFRVLYNDIIHILLQEWKGDKNAFDDFYNVFTLSQCLNIQEFYEPLCEVCKVIIDNRAGKTAGNSDVVAGAIAYMQENFSNPDLTMNALAEYLQISSVTLSVEFKNEMAVKPSDYLVNLRMEKAKELLRDTNMLVKEIGLAVGYEDAHVFMRRFKKYAGMTPGEYRGE